jgi:hypothetical protein
MLIVEFGSCVISALQVTLPRAIDLLSLELAGHFSGQDCLVSLSKVIHVSASNSTQKWFAHHTLRHPEVSVPLSRLRFSSVLINTAPLYLSHGIDFLRRLIGENLPNVFLALTVFYTGDRVLARSHIPGSSFLFLNIITG